MPFAPNPVTTDDLVGYLTTNAGTEVGCENVREAAKQLNVSYATACKRLKSYKSGTGKWNLTVQEIEQAYDAPSANSAANYIPEKDDSYVQFGNFQSLKKLLHPVSSTLRLSRVSRAMVKRSLSSKSVLQRSEN